MKFTATTLIVLVVLVLNTQATTPTYEVLYNTSFPTSGFEYYSNGLYYSFIAILNSTSGKFYEILTPKNCTIHPVFSPQVNPWCFGYVANADNTRTFSVHYLNAYFNESIDSKVIGTFPSETYVDYVYANGFLILNLTGYLNPNYSTVAVYDLINMQPACPKATYDQVNGTDTIYTDGNIFVSGYLDDSQNAYFNLLNCTSGQSYPSTGNNEYMEINLYGFNYSAVFINFFEQNNNNSYRIQPATLDSSNQLRFGSTIDVFDFLPYNSTHFFIEFVSDGKYSLGLYVITSELQIVEVLSFNLGLTNQISNWYPVYGTSWIIFNVGEAIATYDVNAQQIIGVDSTVPSIILSNGSSINMTTYGYFIQSPGEPFYFVLAPFSNDANEIYQDPSDFNQYYTLFVPSPKVTYYKECLLTHVNATSSQISQTIFPNCPLTLPNKNIINIKDVQYDANGNPNAVYKDYFGSVVVVNSTGSNGPFASAYLYATIQLGLNLTNGTINFAGYHITSFVIGRISLATGAVIASQTFVTPNYYNSILKINSQYFALIDYETTVRISIFDVVNFVNVTAVNSDLKLPLYEYSGFVLGFDASNPNFFDGVVFWSHDIFLMNPSGITNLIDIETGVSLYDIVPISENQFIFSLQQIYLYREAVIAINSWGTNSTKPTIQEKDIEY